MNFLELPKRTVGSRKYGLTSIVDFGMPIKQLENILIDYHSYIDIAKLGVGSGYITPNIQDKINLYQQFKIIPYLGGTLFEKCYQQRKLPHYYEWLSHLGVEWLEISNGTLNIPFEERVEIISTMKNHFHILGEVGSKDTEIDMSLLEWRNEVSTYLEAGCSYVITEGRDSGTAGIYDRNGQVNSNLIKGLLHEIDEKKLIFEAPTAKQQMYFINEIGPNVNLGNVKLSDVLLLEAQRQGLRSETFFWEDQEWKLPL